MGHPWVHRVYLDEALPEGAVLSPGLALVRLIVAPPETAPAQAMAVIQIAGPDRGWPPDWIETIFVNKFPKLSRAEILMILDLTDTDLRNTRYFQDGFAETKMAEPPAAFRPTRYALRGANPDADGYNNRLPGPIDQIVVGSRFVVRRGENTDDQDPSPPGSTH